MGGCCTRSANVRTMHWDPIKSVRIDSSFSEAAITELRIFLSEIPDHCRPIINKLPVRQLYNVYQNHKMALNYGLKKNWSLAIFYEHRAIKGLQTLLPMHKDHYIFFHFYNVLSAASLALGEVESAIEGIHITLAILLKHTPMDYQAISRHYHYLAIIFKGLQDWRGAVKYLIKAIKTARLITDFDPDYNQMLEMELQTATYVDREIFLRSSKLSVSSREHVIENVLHDLTLSELKRKSGEDDYDFQRRRTAETITFNIQLETLTLEKTIQLPIIGEILEDV